MSEDAPAPAGRDRALDAFRGLAVTTMVIANFLADKRVVPPWLKHAPDIGLTIIDLIAPMFVLAMAVSFRDSYERKIGRLGGPGAAWETARRYLALIGVGAILSAGQSYALPAGGMVDWGVLQALGVAGLALLAFHRLPPLARLGVGAAILAAYQLLQPWTAPLVLARSHGGMIGSVSWAGMILVGEAIVDLSRSRPRRFLALAGAAAGFLGAALSPIAPISKNRVSASYALVSLGIALVLLFLSRLAYARRHGRPDPLEAWGRRPLALYLAHQLALALFVLVDIPWWHEDSPAWLVLAQLALLLGALSVLAYTMERGKVEFKL